MIKCNLCNSDTYPYLAQRPDYEYGIKTTLDYRCCQDCGLVFASPMPSPEIILSFYSSYSTHKQGSASLLAKLSRRKALRETLAAVGPNKELRILDYGCGNGEFLKELCAEGYNNGTGYDFDPNAVNAARTAGIAATHEWEKISGLFDVIILNHVIEHFINPVHEIKRLSGLLRSGGLFVMRTPNNTSLMSLICRADWRGWETPRHLNIMNKRVLTLLITKSGLSVVRCFNSKAMFFGIFHESLKRPMWANHFGKILRHILAFVCYPWGAGEETVAVARKY